VGQVWLKSDIAPAIDDSIPVGFAERVPAHAQILLDQRVVDDRDLHQLARQCLLRFGDAWLRRPGGNGGDGPHDSRRRRIGLGEFDVEQMGDVIGDVVHAWGNATGLPTVDGVGPITFHGQDSHGAIVAWLPASRPFARGHHATGNASSREMAMKRLLAFARKGLPMGGGFGLKRIGG